MVRRNAHLPKSANEPALTQLPGPLLSTRAGILLALILPVFAIAPLFYPGYFQTHSGFVPLWNVADLRANLGSLAWLPNIATEFDFVRSAGLFPHYLVALLPFSVVTALKTVIGLGWLLGSLGTFFWLRSWLGNAGALLAALVYIYLPYQIATAYVRGAWAETLFWGLLPWALFVITRPARSPKLLLVPVAVFSWLGLGLTQLGLTFWALIFAATLLIVVYRPLRVLALFSAGLGTLLAVVVYYVVRPGASPVIPPTEFADHFLFPFQLVSAGWGFGPSLPGWNDELALQVGLAAVGLTFLGLSLWQRGGSSQLKPVSRTDRRLLFFSMAVLVLILLQFGLSSPVWQLPLFPGNRWSDTLTYPWQLLGLIGLCLSVLAGAVLWLDSRLTRLPLFGSIILITILSVYPYLSPQFSHFDSNAAPQPQAEFGSAQLALLAHEFSVRTSALTVGYNLNQTDIPLAIHGEPDPGDTLLLQVVWQPLRTFNHDLKIFVHLVDSGGSVLAQFDGQPQQGAYPTSQWIPGEVIVDLYPISMPADPPAGPYRVFVGLYDEATMLRLPVAGDDAGRVIIDVD
jgi:hypothetical protein